MKKRIKRFGVVQTAKVFAVIYFICTAVIMAPMALLFGMLGGANTFPFGTMFFVAAPFGYAILGFIITAIGCFTYNIVAKWVGGIVVEVETTEVRPIPEMIE
jgi:hypothetical protein